jgi:hypothetical protein
VHGARALVEFTYNTARRNREAPTAAATTEAQTAVQSIAEISAKAHAKVSTQTYEMVGDSPTPNLQAEGTHQPRLAEHSREVLDITVREECSIHEPDSDSRRV